MPTFHQDLSEGEALKDVAALIRDAVNSNDPIAVIVLKDSGEISMTRANVDTASELIKFAAAIVAEVKRYMPEARHIDIFEQIAKAIRSAS